MSTIANTNAWLERLFKPISLDALNAKAAMLERLDNKYVVGAAVLRHAAAELARHFDILEINGRRTFTYETCYFDDLDLQSYFDHHQGRRQRVKVRMRKYLEAGLCFVEVKLKDKRGATVKKRLPCNSGKFGALDKTALTYVHGVYYDQYRQAFPYELTRVIDMRYVRMTLVAKEGGERMTIDSEMRFFTRIPPTPSTIFCSSSKRNPPTGTASRTAFCGYSISIPQNTAQNTAPASRF